MLYDDYCDSIQSQIISKKGRTFMIQIKLTVPRNPYAI